MHDLPAASTTALTQEFLAEVDAALQEAITSLVHTWRVELANPSARTARRPRLPTSCSTTTCRSCCGADGTGGKRIRPSMAYWGWVAAGRAPARTAAGPTSSGWAPPWSCCTSSP